MVKVGIIGGSGLDDPQLLKYAKEKEVETPYGKTNITSGTVNGIELILLSRHGKNHSITPTNVPYRANVYALKKQGCTNILATTAVGSLREEIKPGDLIFPDQFIDHTKKRYTTFFDKNKVIHLPSAEPFCHQLRTLLLLTASELKVSNNKKGTVITIEGPRFSTRAESFMFRSWGADVINMSTVPEINLANEAGMCYASIAMSTDYDCIFDDRPPVTFNEIVKVMNSNAEKVKKLILNILPKIKDNDCLCKNKVQEEI